jgi:outer membrane protein assembly factor BamA
MFKQTLKITALLFLIFCGMTVCFAQSSTDFNVISEIKIIGNRTTKDKIIIRELPFEIGDTLASCSLSENLERAESNLLNTLLFNFVSLAPVYFDSVHISIYITVEERWYWWPIPIFEIQETNFNTWWQTKDFNKVNYGLFVAKENFRGRKERIAFKFQKGYTEQMGFKYSNPYINKNRTQGVSFSFVYSRNHEINYGTTNNKLNYLKSDNNYLREEYASAISYEFRPKLYNIHRFQLDYHGVNVNDSVLYLNENYLALNEKKSEFLSIRYFLSRDKRNFKSYPTKGYFYSFQLKQDGLRAIEKEISSFYSTVDYRKFFQLTERLYLASSIKGKYSITKAPYYLTTGLGYASNLVRGYELYVIKGDHYGLFKAQVRYGLLQDKIFKIKPLPFTEFDKIPLSIYLGAYFDAGYVDSQSTKDNNFLTNEILVGGGVSIDFVSYYDMVFRIEYSINKEKEHGLFLHFVAPI